jgi:hypothetical protein
MKDSLPRSTLSCHHNLPSRVDYILFIWFFSKPFASDLGTDRAQKDESPEVVCTSGLSLVAEFSFESRISKFRDLSHYLSFFRVIHYPASSLAQPLRELSLQPGLALPDAAPRGGAL